MEAVIKRKLHFVLRLEKTSLNNSTADNLQRHESQLKDRQVRLAGWLAGWMAGWIDR